MTDNVDNRSPDGLRASLARADGDAPAQSDDVTARIRIKDAALQHFADEGYQRTTIRAIARTAGISHGMLRHHFGSKSELRSACDDYVFQVLRRLNTLFLDVPSTEDPSVQSSSLIWRYAARSLVDGSPTTAPIFDEIVVITERQLGRFGHVTSDGSTKSNASGPLLAAMLTAIPLFHEHLSRTLGIDLFSPPGDTLLSLALRDVLAPNTEDGEGSHTMATRQT